MNGIPLMLRLEGECNRCGLCCTAETDTGETVYCEHLRFMPVQSLLPGMPAEMSLGQPGATHCSIYADRVDGMPIRMLNAKGEFRIMGNCFTLVGEPDANSPRETQVILSRGVGRGCSLTCTLSLLDLSRWKERKDE